MHYKNLLSQDVHYKNHLPNPAIDLIVTNKAVKHQIVGRRSAFGQAGQKRPPADTLLDMRLVGAANLRNAAGRIGFPHDNQFIDGILLQSEAFTSPAMLETRQLCLIQKLLELFLKCSVCNA